VLLAKTATGAQTSAGSNYSSQIDSRTGLANGHRSIQHEIAADVIKRLINLRL
jgi:hypothetical protein